MAEEVGNGAATGSKAPKVRVIDASVIAEGAVELIRCTLKELFHGDLVDAALNKAMKTPAVKALIARSKTKGKPKSAKVRSAYQVFVTVCLAKLLASGHRSTIMEAGVLWKALPAIQREQMIARFNLFKCGLPWRGLAPGREKGLVNSVRGQVDGKPGVEHPVQT